MASISTSRDTIVTREESPRTFQATIPTSSNTWSHLISAERPTLQFISSCLMDQDFSSDTMQYQHYSDYSSEGEHWDDEHAATDSILLSLVQSYDWHGALARIKSFPEECKAVGVQGRTPLHVACDHDAPAEVVKALLAAYPAASCMVGTSNMNPLHITCSSQHASVQVVQVLLDGSDLALQMSSMRDVDGDTPLHAACRCGAPIDVIQVLLEANPSAVFERDYEGLTPLLRLWVRYFVILGDNIIEGVSGSDDLKGDLGEAWKKTELLLRCAYHGKLKKSPALKRTLSASSYDSSSSVSTSSATPSGSIFRAVHAAAAVDCPRAVVKIATIIYPEQLEQRDEQGMTPLLIAAKTPIYKVRDLSDDGYMLEDRIHGDDIYNDSSNDIGTESSQPSVIDILLAACPNSATIPDPSGRLPLHLAILSGKRWNEGVRAILDAHPDGLSSTETSTRLATPLLAAIGEKPDYTTVFELLRRDPSLTSSFEIRRQRHHHQQQQTDEELSRLKRARKEERTT